ncbi:MAG: hypothetical protein KGD65_00630 [Candidatus Lokiarchaeota archaeon]|nr:hypothetical protein [Candidatus Lokiarchaeota archaeon]
MPVGFCCENCFLYDEYTTCLKSKPSSRVDVEEMAGNLGEIKLISASIEGELLKVIIEHVDEKKKTLFIDLKKYLQS